MLFSTEGRKFSGKPLGAALARFVDKLDSGIRGFDKYFAAVVWRAGARDEAFVAEAIDGAIHRGRGDSFVLGESGERAAAVVTEHVKHGELAVAKSVVVALLPDATSDAHEGDSEFVV